MTYESGKGGLLKTGIYVDPSWAKNYRGVHLDPKIVPVDFDELTN